MLISFAPRRARGIDSQWKEGHFPLPVPSLAKLQPEFAEITSKGGLL